MKRITRPYVLLSVLLLWLGACKTTRTLTLSRDNVAVTKIEQGKQLMRSKEYRQAAALFQQASDRPFHQHTTVSIYLTGLAHYYAGTLDVASQRFQTLIQEYPRSRYVEEARFHEALTLMRMRARPQQVKGLSQLLLLGHTAANEALAEDAMDHARQYLFYDAKGTFVEDFLPLATDQDKALVMEALAYRKIANGAGGDAEQLFQEYMNEGGSSTPFLDSLFVNTMAQVERIETDIIKIALFLPLHLDNFRVQYLSDIPSNSKPWLEFYEGFSLAVETYQQRSDKKIYVQLFDTRRDTSYVRSQLKELDRLYPDIVVGAVYSDPSRVLAEWAKKRGIPQIVPFSRSLDVAENGQLFLLNPSLEVHGKRMGDFAREVLGLKKVAVFSDGTAYAESMAEGFIQAFDSTGRERVLEKMVVDSVYDRGEDRYAAKDQIPDLVEDMRYEGFDGVYVPIDQQTTAGLILGQINNYNLPVKVMGSYDWWRKFNSVDRELKERYRLLFTASSMYQGDEPGYDSMYQAYLKEYAYPPESWSIEGYDLGKFLLPLLDQYQYEDGIPLNTYLRLQPPIPGIHANYFFDKSQINQSVNVGEFTSDGVFKVTDAMRRDPFYWQRTIKSVDEEEDKR